MEWQSADRTRVRCLRRALRSVGDRFTAGWCACAQTAAATLILLLFAAPVSAQSLLGELQVLRQEFPTPMSKAQLGELLTRTVARAPFEFVLLRKLAGNNCPAMGTLVSCDYIIHAASGQGYDVLQDQEGLAVPTWNVGDHFTPASYVWVGASPPPPAPGPTPTPGPTPSPPVDLSPVLTALDALTDLLGEAQAQTGREHAQIRQAIEGIVGTSPQAPTPLPPEERGVGWREWVLKRIVPAVGAAIGTCLATQCWKDQTP